MRLDFETEGSGLARYGFQSYNNLTILTFFALH